MVARREGFEPPTARSVVLHWPPRSVVLIPWGPRFFWSGAMQLVRIGHWSLTVILGLVARWSQSAVVARPGVW
jgi:hypothetical protein